jgi:hypothetical protein
MASISSSENPLAMRSMTVDGRFPERNACIDVTICSAVNFPSCGTGLSFSLE